jgi:pyruvate/2-oxoglutarate dehydrogenase complex dihydrolipoamide dehydrogenase (E3) component
VAAAGAAGLGAKVALIERRLLGGDCLNFGCVPSKALLRVGRAAADARHAARFGVLHTEAATVDFAAAMTRVRERRATLASNDSAARFRALGVDVFLGEAVFTGRDRVAVNGIELSFARACIATGSTPEDPAIPGLSRADYLTNETLFQLTALPPRMLILGGGPIGCEMAQALSRCGSQVTLVVRGPRLLSRDDPRVSPWLVTALQRDGVTIQFETRVVRVDAERRVATLARSSGPGVMEEREVEYDQVLVATGRKPQISGLNLTAAEVAYDVNRGVLVDDFLRSSNRRIYAAGDVCSSWQFTHAADAMAKLVLRNSLFFGRVRFSSLLIPWCTYTDPEVAHVGWQPHAPGGALAAELVETITVPLAEVDRAAVDGDEGELILHLRRGRDRIVGATIVAPHAADLLAPITLAIRQRVGLNRLADLIFPYPSQGEVLKRAANQYQRRRLTPRVRSLFTWLLRWRRGG